MKKKFLSLILTLALLLEVVAFLIPTLDFSEEVAAAPDFNNSHITPYPVGTMRYAVGFMYFELWSNQAGEWQKYKPEDTVSSSDLVVPYEFEFPDRTVKNVKVTKFDPGNSAHQDYFTESRKVNYNIFADYLSIDMGTPTKISEMGRGTEKIEFTVSVSAKLIKDKEINMRGVIEANEQSYVDNHSPNNLPTLKVYRYYFPVLFEIELNGIHETKAFTTTGEVLSSVYPDEVRQMEKGSKTTVKPKQIADYEYVGYKYSTTGIAPSGGEILTGAPPVVDYKGEYDKYILHLYYKKKANGRHLTKTILMPSATNLSNVFPDVWQDMYRGKSYSATVPSNASYTYIGYKAAAQDTTGAPAGEIISGRPPSYTYNGNNKFYVVYLYYEPSNVPTGTVNIRHMVRGSATDSYKVEKEEKQEGLALPHNKNYQPNTSYGKVMGQSVSYTAYSGTVSSGASAAISLSEKQRTAYVTFFYEKESKFKGFLSVTPSTISFGESFTLKPKDIEETAGCKYIGHRYKIDRNGSSTTNWIMGKDTSTTYSRADYPYVIGAGTHQVYIQYNVSCGYSEWFGPEPLEVLHPTNNRPPEFKVGFVRPSNNKVPLAEVVVGEVLDLVYIEDPSVPTPYDPDGDDIEFLGFDTANGNTAFVRSIPDKAWETQVGWSGLKMDTLGYHIVSARMRDQWGATATAQTMIRVVPPNPIAIAKGPREIKSGRPVDMNLFDSSQSYSPMGRDMNHSRDEWTNKKNVYINDTDKDKQETVSLHVYDSAGLKSLEPGTHTITVKPDLPPIAKLELPPLAIRNEKVTITNKSTSPDGDKIVKATYKYKYDKDNNGFHDDEWVSVSGSVQSVSFTPRAVGKYLWYTKVTEDYGRKGDTSRTAEALLTLDVVNLPPEVSFTLEGNNTNPDLSEPEKTTPAEMLKNWTLYGVNDTAKKPNTSKWWAGKESLSLGKNAGSYESKLMYPYYGYTDEAMTISRFRDYGLGRNNLMLYRTPSHVQFRTPLLLQIPGYNDDKPFIPVYNNLWNGYSGNQSLYYVKQRMDLHYNDQFIYLNWVANRNEYYFALDKRKISPTIAEINPESYLYEYRWTGENPIAFMLDASSLPDKTYTQYDYHYSWPSEGKPKTIIKENTYKKKAGNYMVGDRTIYQLVQYSCGEYVPKSYYGSEIEENKYSCSYYRDYNSGNRSYILDGITEIHSYDAFTGEHIGKYELEGDAFQALFHSGSSSDLTLSHTVDDNLVLYYLSKEQERQDGYTYNVRKRVVISREGKLVDKRRDPFTGLYDRRYTMIAPDGVEYVIAEGKKSEFGPGYADYPHYVYRINKDGSVPWKYYLPYTEKMRSYTMYSNNPRYHNFYLSPKGDKLELTTYSGFMETSYTQHTLDAKTGRRLASYGGSYFDFQNNYVYYTGNASSDYYQSPMAADGYRIYTPYQYNEFRLLSPEQYQQVFTSTVGGIAGRGDLPTSFYRNDRSFLIGDGQVLSVVDAVISHYYIRNQHRTEDYSNSALWLSFGEPTTNKLLYDRNDLGQFVSKEVYDHSQWSFDMTMFEPEAGDYAGLSFRMGDPKNRYAAETDGSHVYLSVYSAGKRTELASKSYPFQQGERYEWKVRAKGDKLSLYINGVPYLEVEDSTYTEGKVGFFSRKPNVDFGTLYHKELAGPEGWSKQYVIWNEETAEAEIRVSDITYIDPEDDPQAGTYSWSIQHKERFIDNQGKSELHGKTFDAPQLVLDKVGDYEVELSALDDPNSSYLFPDDTFAEYRKQSEPFKQLITVHRRPISDFDVKPDKSGVMKWTDRSRDPDRYRSASVYSTEKTGIDYLKTKGIMEKKFYYITPSGKRVNEKLVIPDEKGKYTIAMAVRDEYDAWSDYTVKTVNVNVIPKEDEPPVAGFTTSHINTYRGVDITINSTAYDKEDGARENLPHMYYVRNVSAGGNESIQSDSRTSWVKKFNTLGTFNIRQVVEDSVGQTATFERQVTIHNRKPVATVTTPAATSASKPTVLDSLKPTLEFSYYDADGDQQAQYQLQVYHASGNLLYDSKPQESAARAHTVTKNLQEGITMYTIARVHDGYEWGNWSEPKYFTIVTNRPPTADFDWSPKPVYEGDTVSFTLSGSDPDNDVLTLTFELTSPSGKKTSFPSGKLVPKEGGSSTANKANTANTASTASLVDGSSYPSIKQSLRMLELGDWTAVMTVSDGKAPPVSVRKTVHVNELGILAEVLHTEQWEQYRQQYNKQREVSKHRPANMFWAGERFVLRATTTNTLTETKAISVEATLGDRSGKRSALLRSTGTIQHNSQQQAGNNNSSNDGNASMIGRDWTGDLWDEDMSKDLPDGRYIFVFEAKYSNGIIKRTEVEIVIQGNVKKLVGVHRVW